MSAVDSLSLSALSLVLQGVDVGADLERRPQLDVHAGHQVVLREQQQRLAVDLLQPEGLGHVAAAWRHRQTAEGEVLQRLNRFSGITAKERMMVRGSTSPPSGWLQYLR